MTSTLLCSREEELLLQKHVQKSVRKSVNLGKSPVVNLNNLSRRIASLFSLVEDDQKNEN
ncbi:CLUMA_CG013975, isoform A [Clunio marinus]|uniref:CLUMA_CG013975, isoform A n=1 Tax=Clunio marinus TaxID=568069 RepID=A0A1J1INP6_9DIPT|nr:CLUMA_CG013975, isoform A [Clunio marinus]